jgi:hypothetical protein
MASLSHATTVDGEPLADYIVRLRKWDISHADMSDSHGEPMYQDGEVVIYGTQNEVHHREYSEGEYDVWAGAQERLAAHYMDNWHSRCWAIVTAAED